MGVFIQSTMRFFHLLLFANTLHSICIFKESTWDPSFLLDIYGNSHNIYDCRNECYNNPECEAYTWQSLDNVRGASAEPLSCIQFSSDQIQVPCENCISGSLSAEPSCLVSQPG